MLKFFSLIWLPILLAHLTPVTLALLFLTRTPSMVVPDDLTPATSFIWKIIFTKYNGGGSPLCCIHGLTSCLWPNYSFSMKPIFTIWFKAGTISIAHPSSSHLQKVIETVRSFYFSSIKECERTVLHTYKFSFPTWFTLANEIWAFMTCITLGWKPLGGNI